MSSVHKPKKYSADVIIIGSGAGGAVAAQIIADAGKKVMIIEEDKVGGNCANYSCVPTRALLESANLTQIIKEAPQHGVSTKATKLDYATAIHWQQKSIHHTGVIGSKDNPFTNPNIHLIKGRAHFIDQYTVSVDLVRYTAHTIIVASGASPNIPNINGLLDAGYETYRTFARQKTLPKSIAIIGGGFTGYEYAQIYAAFGVVTHLFESHYHLLPTLDPEVGDCLESTLIKQGIHVHTGSKIFDVHKSAKHVLLTFSQNGQDHHLNVDGIFIATGHTPNTDLGLENALVTHNEDGIKVNKRMQTSQKHIFAVGDVTDLQGSASSAIRQGQIVAHNILHRKNVSFDTHATVQVAYGLPELVVIGKTEREVKLTGLPYQTAIAPLGIVGRSFTSAYSTGFVKIVASHTGIIIGASIVAPHASEFASELTFAVQHHRRACDIANTIHPFSSWSEAVRVAASKIYCI